MSWRALVVFCALVIALFTSCTRRQPLATLEAFRGKVDRDSAAAVGQFSEAARKAEFFVGDGVRTAVSASAELGLADGSKLALDERTLLRFLDHPGARKQRLSVEMGSATFTAGSETLTLETTFGDAILQPGSRVVLTRLGSKLRFEVAIGSAELERDGKRVPIAAGNKVEVEIDLAVIETSPIGSGSGAAPATSAPGAMVEANPASTTQVVTTDTGDIELPLTDHRQVVTVAGGQIIAEPRSRARLTTNKSGTQVRVSEGSVSLQGAKEQATLHSDESSTLDKSGRIQSIAVSGPSYTDLAVSVGDSLVVHDPEPPTVLGFLVPAVCSGGALLELDGKRPMLVGAQRINASFSSGGHRYLLRCRDEQGAPGATVGKGMITVIRDAGDRKLPSTAPMTSVDTDGRNYTVMYQSRLPTLTVSWPKPPGSGPFTLLLVSPHGETRRFTSATPQQVLAAGSLLDGVHQLSFEGGGRRSKVTYVEIRFDNATPTASIASPAERDFSQGASILVSGTALPGWTVSVGGSALPLDAQDRFSARTVAPSAERALAIRFSHPSHGTQYYLRRATGGEK